MQGAEKWARETDSLLELKGSSMSSLQYTKLDYMNVSIASRADGIILQYSGEDGLEDKIDEAVADGIPVVTLMNDAVHSKRQTFVGVSDYQLGSAYGRKGGRLCYPADTKNILILFEKETLMI